MLLSLLGSASHGCQSESLFRELLSAAYVTPKGRRHICGVFVSLAGSFFPLSAADSPPRFTPNVWKKKNVGFCVVFLFLFFMKAIVFFPNPNTFEKTRRPNKREMHFYNRTSATQPLALPQFVAVVVAFFLYFFYLLYKSGFIYWQVMSCTTMFSLEGVKAIPQLSCKGFFLVLRRKQGHKGVLFVFLIQVSKQNSSAFLPSFHHQTAANIEALTATAAALFRSDWAGELKTSFSKMFLKLQLPVGAPD